MPSRGKNLVELALALSNSRNDILGQKRDANVDENAVASTSGYTGSKSDDKSNIDEAPYIDSSESFSPTNSELSFEDEDDYDQTNEKEKGTGRAHEDLEAISVVNEGSVEENLAETNKKRVRRKKADKASWKRSVVKAKRLNFFIPKKDQCYKCNAYKSATDKTLLLEEYESHKKREKDAMLMKKIDKEKAVAEKGSSFRAVTFDLQAILQVPFAGDNQIFYKLKLNVYNFTIFDASNSNGYCYVWDETHGKKGSTEIGTCILKYLYELPETVTHVSSFSDTCGGQNRNKYVAAAMLFAVNKIHHLNVIDLKFMESGHSYLEADAMHATIERARKHKSIYTTREWSVLISTARRNPRPYYVNNLRFDDFYDLQELAATMTPNTTTNNTNQEKVQWLKIKWMRFEKTDPYLIKYKYELSDEEFLLIDVAGRRKRGRQQGWSSYELSKKYSQRIPISLKKKNDLLFLFRTKVIPTEYQQYIQDIPATLQPAPQDDD
nr:unnamed protein product [Callosobruchus chinensis]